MWPMKPRMYRYHWLHIPSGRRGIKEEVFDTPQEFKNALIRWNNTQKTTWKYWAVV